MVLQPLQDEVPSTSTKHPALDDFYAQIQRDAAAKKQKTLERQQQREDAKISRRLRGAEESGEKVPQEVLDLIVRWAMPSAVVVAVRHDPEAEATIVNWDYFKLMLRLMQDMRLLDFNHTDITDINADKAPSGSPDFHGRYLLRYTNSYTISPTYPARFKHRSFSAEKFSLSTEPQAAHEAPLHIMHLMAAAFETEHKFSAVDMSSLRAGSTSTITGGLLWPLRRLRFDARGDRYEATYYDDIIRDALKASADQGRHVAAKGNLEGLVQMCVVIWSLQETLDLYEKHKKIGFWEAYEPEIPKEKIRVTPEV